MVSHVTIILKAQTKDPRSQHSTPSHSLELDQNEEECGQRIEHAEEGRPVNGKKSGSSKFWTIVQHNIDKKLNFFVLVRGQHAFQLISLRQNFVALLQNGVTQKNRRQDSKLKLKICDITKRPCVLFYPRYHNAAKIVVEKQRVLTLQYFTVLDDNVKIY
jgi:hypothetical protein